MKNVVFSLICIVALAACKKDSTLDNFPQKWILTKIWYGDFCSTNISHPEYYILNPTGTFFKSKQIDIITYTASGTFSFKDTKDGKFLDLYFPIGSSITIKESCSPLMEEFHLKSETTMKGTWGNCDGNSYEFERIY